MATISAFDPSGIDAVYLQDLTLELFVSAFGSPTI
jgi:hypothetical protein